MFARSVEKDIWVLGVCADYLEDHGKDGSILRVIADNHFLLDDSGYCSDYYNGLGNGNRYHLHGNGYGDGTDDKIINYGPGNGSGNGYTSFSGNGFGTGCSNMIYGHNNGDGQGQVLQIRFYNF